MNIVLFIFFGFIVGLIARAIMPGEQKLGLLMTTLLGIVGSFIGGFIGSLIQGGSMFQLRSAGIIGSIIGALIVLGVVGFLGRRRFAH